MLAYTSVQLLLSKEFVSGLDQRTTSPPTALSNSLSTNEFAATWYGKPSLLSRLVLQRGLPDVSQTFVRLTITSQFDVLRLVSICLTGSPTIPVMETSPGLIVIPGAPSTGAPPVNLWARAVKSSPGLAIKFEPVVGGK